MYGVPGSFPKRLKMTQRGAALTWAHEGQGEKNRALGIRGTSKVCGKTELKDIFILL